MLGWQQPSSRWQAMLTTQELIGSTMVNLDRSIHHKWSTCIILFLSTDIIMVCGHKLFLSTDIPRESSLTFLLRQGWCLSEAATKYISLYTYQLNCFIYCFVADKLNAVQLLHYLRQKRINKMGTRSYRTRVKQVVDFEGRNCFS